MTFLSLSLSLSLSELSRRLRRLAGALAAVTVAGLAAAPPGVLAETGKPPPRLERITIDGLAPWHRAEKPIIDGEGRIRVIVDLMEEATERQLEAARPLIERFDLKRDRHNPQALLAIEAFERRHGIEPQFRENGRGERERSNVTSWVGASVTAYLTAGQIEAIRRDPDVRLVTEDRLVRFSSNPPWWPSWNGAPWTELNDWGWHAVGGRSASPNSQRVVWIIDSGVAHHADLGSVAARINLDGGSPVGCYAHATHIAGIIGATSGNGQGRRGIYAGVTMVSINGGVGGLGCDNTSSADFVGRALDYVYSQSLVWYSGNHRPNVINLSINWGAQTGWWVAPNGAYVAETNQPKIARAATPGFVIPGWSLYHPGNVVVQSAGNFSADSCALNHSLPYWPWSYPASFSYKPSGGAAAASADDGVLVMGALNQWGGVAAPFSNSYPIGGIGEPGSNVGACIDLWAPGDFIYSTWGMGGDLTNQSTYYSGGQPETCASMSCTSPPHSGWAWLSGTSMAAPHAAAAAAYFIDAYSLTTPAAVEQMLRAGAQTLPNGLKMVKLP
jgi:hypothetical protein